MLFVPLQPELSFQRLDSALRSLLLLRVELHFEDLTDQAESILLLVFFFTEFCLESFQPFY